MVFRSPDVNYLCGMIFTFLIQAMGLSSVIIRSLKLLKDVYVCLSCCLSLVAGCLVFPPYWFPLPFTSPPPFLVLCACVDEGIPNGTWLMDVR